MDENVPVQPVQRAFELAKHLKYKDSYKKNELYWGIGLENELYLEFENYINFEKSTKTYYRIIPS